MDSLMWFAQSLIEKFPVLGIIGSKGVVIVSLATLVIQLAQIIVKLTPTPKDDAVVSKVEKAVGFVMPFLKLFPHINPSPMVSKVFDILKRLAKAAKAYSSEDEQK